VFWLEIYILTLLTLTLTLSSLELVCDLLHAWAKTENYQVIDCVHTLTFNIPPLQDAVVEGGKLWTPDDPVHLRAAAYLLIAEAVTNDVSGDNER
jgi:hypothetical protein